MQNMIFGLIILISVFARPAYSVENPNPEYVATSEEKISIGGELIAQVLAALDMSKTHCQGYFRIHGESKRNKGQRKTEFTLPYLNAQCMLLFQADVQVPLMQPKEKQNGNVTKFLPQLQLGLKNLRVLPQVLIDAQAKTNTQYLKLEVCSAVENGTCVRKPIRVTVRNEKTAGILDIGFYGIWLQLQQNPKIAGRKDFEGYCDSEQAILDFATLKNKIVKPKCLIKGYWEPKNTETPFVYYLQYLAVD